MFGVSLWELLVVLILLVAVVGPDKLPDMARKMGKAFGQFRKSVQDIKEQTGLDEELEALAELRDLPSELLREPTPELPEVPRETGRKGRQRKPRRRVDGREPAGPSGSTDSSEDTEAT